MYDTTPNSQSPNGQSNANEKQNNSQLISHEELENTPFTITTDEEGSYLRLGNYRLTERLKTHDQVIDFLYENQWNTIVNLICAIIDTHDKIKQNEHERTTTTETTTK